MRDTHRRRDGLLALTASAIAGVTIAFAAISFATDADAPAAPTLRSTGTQSPAAPAGGAVTPSSPELVTVSGTPYGRPLPRSLIGVSFEYYAVTRYAGRTPAVLNPILVRLIRDLAPGQSPSIRIGGDSTDWTWAPGGPGLARPHGVRFSLNANWFAVTRALARAAHARLILGINLEANSPRLAAYEARTMLDRLGRRVIAAFELGNEPELYRSFAWYRTRTGQPVPGRPPNYSFPIFAQEFAHIGARLPQLPLAGPAIGGRQWIRNTIPFVAAEPRLGVVTIHRYPLQRCNLPAASHLGPTIAHLLSSTSTSSFAAALAPYVAAAHARGLPLRVDELNSVSCGGADGVSDTFASALWALRSMFELARVGVDGVNIHTFPGAQYGLFDFSRRHGAWHATVRPEYYGLRLFARAAPPGSRLMRLTTRGPRLVTAWATRATNHTLRVVVINDSASSAATVIVRGQVGSSAHAGLTRLTAPAIAADTGTRIGRQSVSRTTSGFVVTLPRASAAMMTLPRR